MRDKGLEQLFWQAAERVGWPLADAAVKGRLEALYLEYTRACEAQNGFYDREVSYCRSFTAADWNDEDTDLEDEDREPIVLKAWEDADAGAVPEDDAGNARAKTAAAYFAALQEVTAEAKRIRKELEEFFQKSRTGNAPEDQKILGALRSVAELNERSTPREAEKLLAVLEEAAYQCMISKKGFLGIRNSAMQKVQELAREGWALAGQAQVDLDMTATGAEVPGSGIDRELPLIRQMQQTAFAVQQSSGRLQRLVRFDDLQADLRSQHRRRNPKE